MPVIPALQKQRQRQEGCKFEASLGYTAGPVLKKRKKEEEKEEGEEKEEEDQKEENI
jgi:hypothetical protein